MSTIEANYANIAEFLRKSQLLYKKHIDYTEHFALEFKELFKIGQHLQSEYAELVRICLQNLPTLKSTKAVIEKNQPENLEEITDGYRVSNKVKNEPNQSERACCTILEEAEPLELSVEEYPENMPSDQSHSSHTDSNCNFDSDNKENNLSTSTRLLRPTNRKFKCDTCNTAFNSKSALDLHQREHKQSNIKITKDKVRIHTGEKPFKCSTCNKGFVYQSKLSRHMRIHTGEKPFKCSICNKGIAQSNNLKAHMRIHTGEKPFKCSICKKGFAQSKDLKVHMRTHTGEKPFKCSICNKGFAQSNNLKVHMRIHTGEKPKTI